LNPPELSLERLLPKKDERRLSLAGWFLCLLSGSFVLQPLDLRIPGGIPVSGVLIFCFVLICLGSLAITLLSRQCSSSVWPRILLTGTLAVCVVFAVWLWVEWLDAREIKNGLAMAVYLAFFGFVVSTRWDVRDLAAAWYSLLVATLVICLVGAWRFVNGYHGPSSEYTGGLIANLMGGYPVYFGVSYTPSTRNSDFLYVVTPLMFSLAFLSRTAKANGRWLLTTLAACFPVALSLCRSGWLAVAAAFFFLFARHLRFLMIATIVALVVLVTGSVSESTGGRLVRNVYASALSLVDPDTAVLVAGGSGVGNYSNAERTRMLREGIALLLENPLGSGAVLISEGASPNTQLRAVHYENFYLDLAVMFGICAPALIATILILPVIRSVRSAREERPVLFSLGAAFCILLGVYCLFNSVMDFAFFWYLAAISAATVSAFGASDQAPDLAKA
jgi:hypothetical protein